jgi:hypothetical protein
MKAIIFFIIVVFSVQINLHGQSRSENLFKKKLETNIKYPDDAREMGYQGKVLLEFDIKKGKLRGVKTLRSLTHSCDSEVVSKLKFFSKSVQMTDGKHQLMVYFSLKDKEDGPVVKPFSKIQGNCIEIYVFGDFTVKNISIPITTHVLHVG